MSSLEERLQLIAERLASEREDRAGGLSQVEERLLSDKSTLLVSGRTYHTDIICYICIYIYMCVCICILYIYIYIIYIDAYIYICINVYYMKYCIYLQRPDR